MLNRSKLWASLLLVATFAAGATVGGVISSAWGDRDRGQSQTRGERRPGERRERGFTAELAREVNLTPAQRDSVRAILRRYDPVMRGVWESTRPTFDSLRREIHGEIARVLTEEQRVAFQRWTARRDTMPRKRSKENERAR